MLASVYTDDEERGHAIGIALGGLAMGVLGVYTYIFTYNRAALAQKGRAEYWLCDPQRLQSACQIASKGYLRMCECV